ncbi:hypothetical protein LIER_31793 [Lithospermum erythrorhizon]|uniref:Uncharacterized protein n=1 Tax=Lithospermum erythrorhizon TaxID=34254 RepID=A0AAV3RVJ6_LITER
MHIKFENDTILAMQNSIDDEFLTYNLPLTQLTMQFGKEVKSNSPTWDEDEDIVCAPIEDDEDHLLAT